MKTTVHYLDDKKNFVDRDKAKYAIIRTEDENGNLVREEFQSFVSEEEIQKKFDSITLTKEDEDFINSILRSK